MKRAAAILLALAWGVARAGLPAVPLTVELRVVDEAAAAGRGDYTVSTRAASAAPVEALQLRVGNGQTGSLRWQRSTPVQWVQAAAAAPGASASRAGGAVVNALDWLQAGQALEVQASWPGGERPVALTIRYEAQAIDAATGAALPSTRRHEARTTLDVALDRWTTLAAIGPPAEPSDRGHWSTRALDRAPRRLLQVRVGTDAARE